MTMSTVASVTPSLTRQQVQDMLGVSRATIYRYVAAYRACLTVTEDDGHMLFSPEDVDFLRQVKAAKSDAALAALADYQRERIAILCAGVDGGRPEAEAIRRELRAQADTLIGVPARIRALLGMVPHLADARMATRLIWFYSTYYQSTDLAKLDTLAAPQASTVERAWRAVLGSRRVSAG